MDASKFASRLETIPAYPIISLVILIVVVTKPVAAVSYDAGRSDLRNARKTTVTGGGIGTGSPTIYYWFYLYSYAFSTCSLPTHRECTATQQYPTFHNYLV